MSRSVVIIGAGFGGIGAAIELRAHGYTDVTILDASSGIGGHVARELLPGRRVRRPEPPVLLLVRAAADWSRLCSPQSEILDYLRTVAREHGVARPRRPEHPGHRVPVGRRGAALARRRRDRRRAADLDGGRGRRSPPASCTSPRSRTIPGRDDFAGHSFHSAALGPRPRPHRHARRRHRHRGQRRAVRAGDRAERSVASRSSSAPATGSCRGATCPTRGGAAR